MPTTEERAIRIDTYREKSRFADRLAESGKTNEAMNLLQEYHRIASDAGDEDYRLFFEAELCDCTTSNLPAQIELIEEGLTWSHNQQYPPDYFLIRAKGNYLSVLGKTKAAIELYDYALAIKPNNNQTLRNKGVTLIKMGEMKAAIELFENALAINPNDHYALHNKGVALSNIGDMKAAIELFDQALAIKPNDFAILRSKGVVLIELGEMKSALELFDRALTIKPDDFSALRDKGVALSKLGEMKTAIELFNRALAVKPDDVSALCQKGVTLCDLGERNAALELFDRALSIDPNNYNALCNKGICLYELGEMKTAIEVFDYALAINPNGYDALRQKGVCLYKLGDIKGAIELIELALTIKPDDHRAIRDLAMAAFKMKDYTTAYEKIRQAVKIAPKERVHEFRVLMKLLGKNPIIEWNTLFPEEDILTERISRLYNIRGSIGKIMDGFDENNDQPLKQKEADGYADITNKMRDILLIESDITYNLFNESKTLDKRSSAIIVLLGSSCQTASAIAKLSEHPEIFLGECYILARAFIEKIINYCYLLVCDDDEYQRFFKYTIQKSFRKLDRNITIDEHEIRLKYTGIPDFDSNPILHDAISAFTSKAGKEQKSWTIKSLRKRISTILKNSKLEPVIFMTNVLTIYEDASEAVHGSLYGCSFQGGFYYPNFNRNNLAEGNQNLQKSTALLLWGLVLLFHQTILLISENNHIDEYVDVSSLNEDASYKVMKFARRREEKEKGLEPGHKSRHSWTVHYNGQDIKI